MNTHFGVGTTETADVRCEHGVFTSVRSPTGTGYRLIAASAGMTADEKREIVACAPSNGSLCDSSAGATALVSFRLSSGRQCLLFSRHAGPEPTGRGGLRVETHVLVLDAAVYRQFGCDPQRVRAARDAAPVPPAPTRQSTIPPLVLPGSVVGHSTVGAECRVDPVDHVAAERLASILAAVLGGSRLVGVVPEPHAALAVLLSGVPAMARARLSLSCGLSFAPARAFALVLVKGLAADKRGLAEEHGFSVVTWETLAPPTASPLSGWLHLARECWITGRMAELDALSAELTDTAAPEALAQVATLWADAEHLDRATPDEAAAIERRHATAGPLSAAYARRREQLVAQLASRGAGTGITDLTATQ
ncbi:MAG: hypothetical protein AB1601_11085 [Planctomycetota bacterium]